MRFKLGGSSPLKRYIFINLIFIYIENLKCKCARKRNELYARQLSLTHIRRSEPRKPKSKESCQGSSKTSTFVRQHLSCESNGPMFFALGWSPLPDGILKIFSEQLSRPNAPQTGKLDRSYARAEIIIKLRKNR